MLHLFVTTLDVRTKAVSQFTYLYYALKVYSFCEEKVHAFECVAKE